MLKHKRDACAWRVEDFFIRRLRDRKNVFTDADAFGDGMNMASRISDQAAGGEICFSDFVFQNIRNREDIKVDVAGLVQLKNVEHPVQLYKIIPTV